MLLQLSASSGWPSGSSASRVLSASRYSPSASLYLQQQRGQYSVRGRQYGFRVAVGQQSLSGAQCLAVQPLCFTVPAADGDAPTVWR